MVDVSATTDIKARIELKLAHAFAPQLLEAVNESHAHNVPKGAQTHFKVVLVSDVFAGKSLVARHRMVYQSLVEEMQGGVHALALHTYTPAEWRERQENAPESPACRGGGTKK